MPRFILILNFSWGDTGSRTSRPYTGGQRQGYGLQVCLRPPQTIPHQLDSGHACMSIHLFICTLQSLNYLWLRCPILHELPQDYQDSFHVTIKTVFIITNIAYKNYMRASSFELMIRQKIQFRFDKALHKCESCAQGEREFKRIHTVSQNRFFTLCAFSQNVFEAAEH